MEKSRLRVSIGNFRRYFVLTKYYLGDQIRKNDTSGARGTYGGEMRCVIQDFGGET
jgi:hypothetical protein